LPRFFAAGKPLSQGYLFKMKIAEFIRYEIIVKLASLKTFKGLLFKINVTV